MGKAKTVLVADDNAALIDELVAAFEDAGYEVATAADGEEVFRRMTSHEPAALLLDVYMPRLDGTDVCRMLKAHPRWRSTFLVVMSSRLGDADARTYTQLGADALLRKPFDPAEAVALVRRAIGDPGAV